METLDGRQINVDFASSVYFVDSKKIIQCNIHDITERKQAEEALSEKEKKYRELFDNAPIGYHELDANGRITRINHTELNMLGYTAEEVTGQFAWKFVGDEKESRQRVLNKMNGILLPIKSEERIYSRKDGTTFPALVQENYLLDSENKIIGIRTTLQDITLLKKAENELRKFSRVVAQSPASVVITSPDGNIEYVNDSFCKISGYNRKEVIGKNPSILKSDFHPNNFYEELWDIILSGKEWKGEILNKKKNGDLYWESQLISPLVNEDGDITNFISIKEDTTDKKKMLTELIDAKEMAEVMNKLKSSFLANMSHELRTPLIGILGYAEILEGELKDTELIELARTIKSSGKRLNTTLNNILDISKLESGNQQANLKELDLFKFLREYVKFFKTVAVEKGLSFNFESGEEILNVFIDEEMIITIIDNLLGNAIKYTESGGITLIARREEGEVVIEIKDTGIGVPEHLQKLIFEPFRQASEGYDRSFEGTGLGLTLVKKYTNLMGGTITLKSKIGEGSTFILKFPVYNKDRPLSVITNNTMAKINEIQTTKM